MVLFIIKDNERGAYSFLATDYVQQQKLYPQKNIPDRPPISCCSLANTSKYWYMMVTANKIPVPDPIAPVVTEERALRDRKRTFSYESTNHLDNLPRMRKQYYMRY